MNLLDPVFFLHIVFLGAVAGFTIFLGIPLARLSPSRRVKSFLNALSVGILIFLFVEITYRLIESVDGAMKLAAAGLGEPNAVLWNILLFGGGFAASLLSLVVFEMKFLRHGNPDDSSPKMTPKRLAIVIACGIGLHNLSEGLVIGQSFAAGAISFGYLLVIGFALHNATEGFGIAGPLAGEKPSIKFLLLAGLIGGGPTFIGTIIGATFISERLEAFFLALASGAILYIIGELIHLGKLKGQHLPATFGLMVGFFVAFGSELLIEDASMKDLKKLKLNTVHISINGYKFSPDHFTIPAGETTKLVVDNRADMIHEVEILGAGAEVEERLNPGEQAILYVRPKAPRRLALLCDMPGHLGNGMYGVIDVLPAN